MARVDELFNFLQTPGLSDQQIAAEINRLGVTPSEVSQLTGVPVAEVQSRLAAATSSGGGTTTVGGGTTTVGGGTTTVGGGGGGGGGGNVATRTGPTFGTAGETALYNFLQTPGLTDAQIRAEANRLGVTAQQIADMTGVSLADVQRRLAGNTTTTTTTTTGNTTTTTGGNTTTTGNNTNLSTFENWLRSTPGLTDAQILAEMNRLGVTGQQVAGVTGLPINQVQNRISNLLPFSNATQGFEQQFRNYTSVPIGAQYNPSVTGGMSPYGQIMGQMQPLMNPYATVQSGLSMGGYDPNIYDRNLLSNFIAQRAADAAAERNAATAAQEVAESAGAYKGGLITKVMGPKPPTPDDGLLFVQKGEYVVKKDAVDKYGKGLLDMVNEGKIPAKKIKSLLD